jgi:hypothetical protein
MFVLTGPGVLHEGFNAGYNVAEAVNFLVPEWISELRNLNRCTCDENNFLQNPSDMLDVYTEYISSNSKYNTVSFA